MIRGIYRMSPRQFRKAIEAGVFGEPKLRRYASFRIPVYWIVDLNRRIIEVRTQPYGKGKQAGHARCDVYQEHDHVPVVLDGDEIGRLAVTNLLP
jgi:hypothetical protein